MSYNIHRSDSSIATEPKWLHDYKRSMLLALRLVRSLIFGVNLDGYCLGGQHFSNCTSAALAVNAARLTFAGNLFE